MNKNDIMCSFPEVVWSWDFPHVDSEKKIEKQKELVSPLMFSNRCCVLE